MAGGSRVVALALVALLALYGGAGAQSLAFSLFERYLEPLRVQAGIPGLSAAIVLDGQIVWERSLGFANLERSIAARPDTPYNVGDLTQTFTSVMLAICGEYGLLRPDDPLRRWVPLAPDPPATLRQVLSHTSGATGGFKYDPARFALLTGVVDACGNQPYRKSLATFILDRFVMLDAVPGRDVTTPVAGDEPLFDVPDQQQYAAVLQRLATPYKVDKRGRATSPDQPLATINASTGLIASVRDLAKYDAALDILVRQDTLAFTWTNVTANGVALPTALGWFSQPYEGERLVWHFGLVPEGYSSLILKIPARRLTLILLANSDGLSAPFSLQEGDVTTSLFARTFLRLFL